jgi:hypothetical protein
MKLGGVVAVLLAASFIATGSSQTRQQDGVSPRPGGPDSRAGDVASSQKVEIGGSTIQVDFASGDLDLETANIFPWVRDAISAVTTFYGHFPVARARILIVPVAGQRGIVQGTTWGDFRGFPGFTRIRLGQHTTQKDLAEDWTMTHELVHMAFPSLPDDQHWMEEGLATYVEPIARVQAGTLPAKQIWSDMVRDMPKGEPRSDDRGMDRTHTWGRTYWGGAMFCLVADVTIRQQTGNRKGLQDALRAIVTAGGTIDNKWPLGQALKVGDQATGTTVLSDLYQKWGDTPQTVDLPGLWTELGIVRKEGAIEFSPDAPLARIRTSITAIDPISSR